MITTWVLQQLIAVLDLALFWLPVVTELPFNLDVILTTAVGIVKGIVVELPFLQVVLDVFYAMLGVKLLLFSWHWVKWIIERIK